MATICKIGETKEIRGKLYRKAAALKEGLCTGCAFLNKSCPGGSVAAPIEGGGAECHNSIWKLAPTAKASKTKVSKHAWAKIPLNTSITKSGLIDIANELGAKNAKLKNQIADLKKNASK